jgi:hypothetical protein
MKAEGARSGVPDVCCAIAREHYHGLFLEFKKTKTGRVEADQVDWHNRLFNAGYKIEVVYTWVEARKIVMNYLGHVA